MHTLVAERGGASPVGRHVHLAACAARVDGVLFLDPPMEHSCGQRDSLLDESVDDGFRRILARAVLPCRTRDKASLAPIGERAQPLPERHR